MREVRYSRLGAEQEQQHGVNALLPAAHVQSLLIFREGKLQFTCGALSILLAVICAVVVAVIVDRAPQIFMNMGEVYMGQNDLQLFSTRLALNYTRVSEILEPYVCLFDGRFIDQIGSTLSSA